MASRVSAVNIIIICHFVTVDGSRVRVVNGQIICLHIITGSYPCACAIAPMRLNHVMVIASL